MRPIYSCTVPLMCISFLNNLMISSIFLYLQLKATVNITHNRRKTFSPRHEQKMHLNCAHNTQQLPFNIVSHPGLDINIALQALVLLC